jgi:hypothetical protein
LPSLSLSIESSRYGATRGSDDRELLAPDESEEPVPEDTDDPVPDDRDEPVPDDTEDKDEPVPLLTEELLKKGNGKEKLKENEKELTLEELRLDESDAPLPEDNDEPVPDETDEPVLLLTEDSEEPLPLLAVLLADATPDELAPATDDDEIASEVGTYV